MQNVPKSSSAFFQEYFFETLDGVKHAALIMERLLAYGNRAEIRWLFDNYGVEDVRNWVKEHGERLLPRRRYALWRVLFDLPGNQIAERHHAWPY